MVIIIDDDKCTPIERFSKLEALPLLYALNKFDSKEQAARFLSISVRTVRSRMKCYGITTIDQKQYDWHGRLLQGEKK